MERRERFNRALGRAIARHRGENTQQKVWTAVGMSKSAYRRLEQGQVKTFNSDELLAIAALLDTPLHVLVREAEEAMEADDSESNPAADSFGSALGF